MTTSSVSKQGGRNSTEAAPRNKPKGTEAEATHGGELERLRRQVEELKARVSALEKHNGELKEDLGRSRQEEARLNAALETANRRTEDLTAKLAAEKARVDDLDVKLAGERLRADDLDERLTAEKGRANDLDARLNAERKRTEALTAEVTALKLHAEALQRLKDVAEQGRTQAETRVGELTESVDRLNKSIADTEKVEEEEDKVQLVLAISDPAERMRRVAQLSPEQRARYYRMSVDV